MKCDRCETNDADYRVKAKDNHIYSVCRNDLVHSDIIVRRLTEEEKKIK